MTTNYLIRFKKKVLVWVKITPEVVLLQYGSYANKNYLDRFKEKIVVWVKITPEVVLLKYGSYVTKTT